MLRDHQQHGIILLDKPPNITSFHAIDTLKKRFRLKKIGHAGTLDPFASGLLLACVNEATKLSNYLMDGTKHYLAKIVLGVTSSSDDPTGEILRITDPFGIAWEDIENILKYFVGAIEQVPPDLSALKFKGKPFYYYTRRGIKPPERIREVVVRQIRLLSFSGNCLWLHIIAEKGTYIRALARDIGRALGCGAYLEELRRTAIGPFHIRHATILHDILSSDSVGPFITPLNAALPQIPRFHASDKERIQLMKGQPIRLTQGRPEWAPNEMVQIFSSDQILVAIAQWNSVDFMLQPKRILNVISPDIT